MSGNIGVTLHGNAAPLQTALAQGGAAVEKFGATANKTLKRAEQDALDLHKTLAGLGGQMGTALTAGFAVAKVAEFSRSMIDAQVNVDRLRNSLSYALGDGKVGQELDYLRKTTNTLGLEFNTASQMYVKFAAAAKGSAIEGKGARDVFESIGKASTVMGLGVGDVNGIMLALTQIMSKGKVQAEEIRGQLGERLPGAFAIAARAMGVTTGEFSKMLELGQVVSEDFLPKFAAQMEAEFAGSFDKASLSMQTSMNRLESAWVNLKTALADDVGISKIMALAAGQTATGLNTLAESFRNMANSNSASEFFYAAFYSAQALDQELKVAEDNLKELSAKLATRPESIYLKSEAHQAWLLVQELRSAKTAQDALSNHSAPKSQSESRIKAQNALSAQVEKDRAAVDELMTRLSGVPQGYITTMKQIAALHSSGALVGDEYARALDNAHKLLAKPAAEKISEAAKAMAFYNDLMDQSSGYTKTYAEDQNKLALAFNTGSIKSYEEYTLAVNKLLEKQPFMVALTKEQTDAIEREADATIAAGKAQAKHLDTLQSGLEKLKTSTAQQEDHNAAIGLGKDALANLEAARLTDQAATLEGIAIKTLDKNLDYAQYELYKSQAAELRNLAALKVAGAQKQVATDAAQDMAKEQKKAAEESAKYWEDALMRAFESGKGFFESLWDSIKNTLKTQVLKVLVTGTLTGFGGMASAATGGASDSVLGLVNGAANLNTLYGAGSQLLFGGAAGASTASLLGANAVGALGGDALGTMIALNGGWAGVATGTTAAGAAGSAAAGGEALAGMSSTGYGVIVAAAIAAIMYITSRGETRMGASYTSGADGSAYKSEGPSGGEIAGDAARSIFANTQAGINATLAAVGSSATITGFTAGLESSENGKGFAFAGGLVNGVGVGEYKGRNGGQFAMSDLSPQQAFEAYVTQMNQVTLEALQAATDVPALIADTLRGIDISKLDAAGVAELTQTVQTVIGSVNTLRESLKALPMDYLHGITFKAAAALVSFSGGMEQLNANLSGFYDNFYDAAEKTSNLTRNVTDALAAQNITLPKVDANLRAWYRSEVERLGAMDLSIAANAQAYASVLALQGSVAQLATGAEAAAKAVADAAARLQADIISAQDSAMSDYMSAQADYASIIAAEQEAAAQAMQQAADASAQAAEAIRSAMASAGQGIAALIRDLTTTAGGTLDPMALMRSTQRAYLADLSGARSGDVEASGRIAASARAYLDASGAVSGNNRQAATVAQVVAELGALPAVKTYEQQLLDAVNGISSTVTTTGASNTADLKAALATKLTAELTLDARAEILKIINLTVTDSNLTPEQKALALLEAQQIDKLIKLSANNLFSATDQQLALATTGTVAKTFTAAMGAYDTEAMLIAAAQSNTIEKIIRASGGVLTLDQQVLLNGITKYNKDIEIGVKIDSSELSAFQQTLMSIFGTIDITALDNAGVDLSGVISRQALDRLQSVNAYVQSFDWVNTDLATRASQMHAIRTMAIAYGVSSQDVATAIGHSKSELEGWYEYLNVPFFATGGMHAGGLRIVGENGPELEATGPSRIYNAADTMAMLRNPQANNDALVAEIRRLNATNEALERRLAAIERNTQVGAVHQADSADSLRNLKNNGVQVWTDPAEPLKTEAV
jgi:tape measure domain-containing protein